MGHESLPMISVTLWPNDLARVYLFGVSRGQTFGAYGTPKTLLEKMTAKVHLVLFTRCNKLVAFSMTLKNRSPFSCCPNLWQQHFESCDDLADRVLSNTFHPLCYNRHVWEQSGTIASKLFYHWSTANPLLGLLVTLVLFKAGTWTLSIPLWLSFLGSL